MRSNRSAAAGSRSMQITRPAGPSRSPTARACPPPPNVQSITVWPPAGSSRSTSSRSRTGTCSVGIRRSVAERRGGRGSSARAAAITPRPPLARSASARPRPRVPDLEMVVRADDHARPPEPGVLDQVPRDPHPAGAVERLVVRAGVEPAPHHPALRMQRALAGDESVGERLVRRGRIDRDAVIELLEEHDAFGQGGAEPGGDREPVLRVEGVLVLAAKRQSGGGVWTGVARWEEPHHPGPVGSDCVPQ